MSDDDIQAMVESIVQQACRDEIVALLYRHPHLAAISAEDLATIFTAGARSGATAMNSALESTAE